VFTEQGADFIRFYARVAELAALPKPERRATLKP
jgi:predicted aminopeptidase